MGAAGDVTVVVPSARTHGFAGAGGLKSCLPLAHERFARDLDEALGPGSVLPWDGPAKTFHAKGLWALAAPGRCAAAHVGSSNFNQRSAARDLELGAIIIAFDEALQGRLAREWRRIRRDARPFAAPEQPWWTPILLPILRPFM